MKTFLLSTCALFGVVQGHAILTKPKSRNFLASPAGGNNVWPWESCAQCLSDGGSASVQQTQLQLTGTSLWLGYPEAPEVAMRHAACGADKFADSGAFAPLSPSYSGGANRGAWGHSEPFVQGSVVSLDVEIHAHHKGHFEFYICDKAGQDPGAETDAECLNQYHLQRAPDLDNEVSPIDPNHPERYYVPPQCALSKSGPNSQPIVENMRFMLPDDLFCEHCVLQFVYVTGNSCNPNGYAEYNWPEISETCPLAGSNENWWSPTLVNCFEGSYPEEFWNCADVRILARNDGTENPTRVTAPPTQQQITFPPTTTPASQSTTVTEPPVSNDPVQMDDSGGLLVIVGLTTEYSREDAGTDHPVLFRFYNHFDQLMFAVDLGEIPDGSGTRYEHFFPDSIASGSDAEMELVEGIDVAFGEICVEMNDDAEPDDALIISRRDTFAWVGDVEFVSSCASPYMKLRVEPGECERFPLLPIVYDSETNSPTVSMVDNPTPSPSFSSPTSSPTLSPTIVSSQANCVGEPCADLAHCRSQWGFCGNGPAWCNDASTWIPSCGSSPPVEHPSPPPTEPPASQPSAAPPSIPSSTADPTMSPPPALPTPSSTSQPSFPTFPDGGDSSAIHRQFIGNRIRRTMGLEGQRFENSVLLYETPSLQWEPSSVYRFDDMMVALESMWTIGMGNLFLYMGEPMNGVSGLEAEAVAESNRRYALVNIAAFLAQSMQETIRYNACDENSWDLFGPANKYPVSNSCGQLGQSYQDYQCTAEEAHMQCEVDPNLELHATTHAQWYGAPAPLFCGPKSKYPETGFWDYSWPLPWNYDGELEYEGQRAGRFDNSAPYANRAGRTDVEGCCYWGRGVIQTTGICNFGKLNFYLGEGAVLDGRNALYPDINFCKRPDLICDPDSGHPELKWVAGLFYWMESVQQYDVDGWNYLENLREFVDSGMPNPGDDTGFINSVSGIVNRGCHNPPCAAGHLHAGRERAQNFKTVLEAMNLL
jgi:hypothetical protein